MRALLIPIPMLMGLLGWFGAAGPFASAEALPDSVSYYYGTVKYVSPDGSVSYGGTDSLVKRVVSPRDRAIVESVLQPTRRLERGAAEFVTTLSRRGDSTAFDAADAEGTFSGTIVFRGKEWEWDRWAYAIRLASGGSVEGKGALLKAGIQTEQLVLDAAGKPLMRMIEALPPVDAAKYAEIRERMLGN